MKNVSIAIKRMSGFGIEPVQCDCSQRNRDAAAQIWCSTLTRERPDFTKEVQGSVRETAAHGNVDDNVVTQTRGLAEAADARQQEERREGTLLAHQHSGDPKKIS